MFLIPTERDDGRVILWYAESQRTTREYMEKFEFTEVFSVLRKSTAMLKK